MSDFRLTYDGVALQASTMDVRDLAPALLAAGDLLDAANRVLNGDSQRAQTSVKASFKVGSFGIDFNLATDFAMKVRDLFSSNDAAAITNAIGILGALGFLASNGKKSLIEVMKWIKNRRIIKIESHINGTSATLHVDDEQTEIDIKVLSLLRDLAVREAIDKLLSPLDTEGIDIFATGSDDKIITTIRKEERCWFKTPELADDLVLDDTRKMAFSIISLAFKEDNKWRLHDGSSTIHATISDTSFLHRVDQNVERFAKGDMLICNVRVKQWQTNNGAKTEYEVIEVLEHRNAIRQISLSF